MSAALDNDFEIAKIVSVEQKVKVDYGATEVERIEEIRLKSGEVRAGEIVRFEVIDAQRVDYQYKFQNPDLANLSGRVDLDFATATDFIYWPFNGEFWRDELGYYHYTEPGSCK